MQKKADSGAEKPLINLYGIKGPGLIILRASGVLYSNQTGGLSCYHPAEEGVFVPLELGKPGEYESLMNHFGFVKYHGGCCDGIDTEDADLIDSFLHQDPEGNLISVDRSRVKDSHEAWVHVTVSAHGDRSVPGSPLSWLFHGFGAAKGILTWQNSD
jgi:hypothetical protein